MTIQDLEEAAGFLEKLKYALVEHGVTIHELVIKVGGNGFNVSQELSDTADEGDWHLELVEYQ